MLRLWLRECSRKLFLTQTSVSVHPGIPNLDDPTTRITQFVLVRHKNPWQYLGNQERYHRSAAVKTARKSICTQYLIPSTVFSQSKLQAFFFENCFLPFLPLLNLWGKYLIFFVLLARDNLDDFVAGRGNGQSCDPAAKSWMPFWSSSAGLSLISVWSG